MSELLARIAVTLIVGGVLVIVVGFVWKVGGVLVIVVGFVWKVWGGQ